MTRRPKLPTAALRPEAARVLQALVADRGEFGAAKRLGTSDTTIVKLGSGGHAAAKTIARIEAALLAIGEGEALTTTG